MNKKVSVIIPVYNAEKYLEQCLDSVISQTLKEIEIICVDDGSTDRSVDILRQYKMKDPRVIVIEQKNAGAGSARNNGMASATGEYLSFLDADDFFSPTMLEETYNRGVEKDCDLVVFRSDQYKTDEDKYVFAPWVVREKELPPYQPFNHRSITTNVFKVFVGWAWDKLFKAEFIREKGLEFQEQRTSNDMLFVFSSVVLAERIGYVDSILAHQRRDARDSLSKTRENSWHCFYDALLALRDELKKENLWMELEKDYINYALHFTMWNYDTLAEPTKGILKERLTEKWLEDLGISDKKREDFYNKKEYDHYVKEFLA